MNIYFQRTPDTYVGPDVSVTIHYNTRAEGLADAIARAIKTEVNKITVGTETITIFQEKPE